MRERTRFFIQITTIIAVFSLSVSGFYHVGWINGVRFFLFQIIYVLLPGLAIALWLNLSFISNTVEWFGISYLLGWCVDLIFYIIYMLLGIHGSIGGILFSATVLSISSIAILYKLSAKGMPVILCEKGAEWICTGLLIIVLLAYVLISFGGNYIPTYYPKGNINIDTIYWTGNIIELTKHFPPLDFRHYPNHYNYHYFSSIQLALASMITGIRPYILATAFHFIQPACLLVFGAYALFYRLSKSIRIAGIASFILLFSTGHERYTMVTWIHHIYVCGFGFDYGLGIFLWCMLIIYEYFKEERLHWKTILLLTALIAIDTGTKGSNGVALVSIVGIVCIDKLLKKQYANSIIGGALTLTAFLMIYFFVVNVVGYAGLETNDYVQSVNVFNPANRVERLEGIVKFRDFYSYIVHSDKNAILKFGILSVIVVVYILYLNPVITILAVISVIGNKNRPRMNLYQTALLVTILLLDVLTLNMRMYGGSEQYFALMAYPVMIAFAVYNLRGLDNKKLYSVLYGLMLLSVLTFVLLNRRFRVYECLHITYKTITNQETYYIFEEMDRAEIMAYETVYSLPGDKMLSNMDRLDDRKASIMACVAEKYLIRDEDLNAVFEGCRSQEECDSYMERARAADIRCIVFVSDEDNEVEQYLNQSSYLEDYAVMEDKHIYLVR